jgi:hypothetical protein
MDLFMNDNPSDRLLAFGGVSIRELPGHEGEDTGRRRRQPAS